MKIINNLIFIITGLVIIKELVLVIFGGSEPDNQDLLMFISTIYLNLYCKIDNLKTNNINDIKN